MIKQNRAPGSGCHTVALWLPLRGVSTPSSVTERRHRPLPQQKVSHIQTTISWPALHIFDCTIAVLVLYLSVLSPVGAVRLLPPLLLIRQKTHASSTAKPHVSACGHHSSVVLKTEDAQF